jgi:hypothetical protein
MAVKRFYVYEQTPLHIKDYRGAALVIDRAYCHKVIGTYYHSWKRPGADWAQRKADELNEQYGW